MSVQSIFQTLYKFFPTSRPRFWIYILGPFLIGIIAAFSSIDSWAMVWDSLRWSHLWLFLYFTFPANLLIYGINDIFDYETDKLNQKKQDYEKAIAPEQQRALWISIIVLNIPFLLLSILPNPYSYLFLFIFCLSAVFYSAPPLRAKAKPVLDTIVSGLIYISPGFVWYFISWGTEINWMIWLAGLARSMAMHAYSAIPDIEADTQSGIQTVATLYGKKGTLIFCMVCYLLAIVLSFPAMGWGSLGLGAIYLVLMTLSFRSDVFRIYTYFPRVNTAIGFLLFLYVIALKLWWF